MAIYSSVPPPSQAQAAPPPPPATNTTVLPASNTIAPVAAAPLQPIDVATWASTSLQSLSISPSARGTGVTLSIPLDEDVEVKPKKTAKTEGGAKMRRDSMKRREALLKGKEGSRRRQRWENGMSYLLFTFDPSACSLWDGSIQSISTRSTTSIKNEIRTELTSPPRQPPQQPPHNPPSPLRLGPVSNPPRPPHPLLPRPSLGRRHRSPRL
ncbi:MAG: hypothetical protein CL912_32190 [Deltaproteobacteria bacterium]|nr:hypothetical protein [Deltaproteobacteria bacterium]